MADLARVTQSGWSARSFERKQLHDGMLMAPRSPFFLVHCRVIGSAKRGHYVRSADGSRLKAPDVRRGTAAW